MSHSRNQGIENSSGIPAFEYEKLVHAQYIASRDEGKQLSTPDLIFDYLITQKDAHKHYFDFGMSTKEGDRHLNQDPVTQKEELEVMLLYINFF